MNWINAALLSTVVFGMVNILDSHLVFRRMPNLRVYLLIKSTFYLVYSIIIFFLFPIAAGTDVWVIILGMASTLIRIIGLTFMLYTMTREDISQIIPVAFSHPFFVAIMAVPLLGETLNYLQWLAIIIVVSGAVMVSIKKSSTGATTVMSKMFLLLFGVSLLFAVADLTSKYALAYLSAWNMFFFASLSMFIVWVTVSLRPHVIRQLVSFRPSYSTLAIIVVNEILVPLGMVLMLLAIERGPVSLVSTVFSSRPIYVAIFSIIVSRLFPGFLIRSSGKGLNVLRLVATAMIVAGIAIIYLT